jgi:hypothetical protein
MNKTNESRFKKHVKISLPYEIDPNTTLGTTPEDQ